MMGISPRDALDLSWWEYGAITSTWNERHSTDDADVDAPDGDMVALRFEKLARSGLVGSIH